MRAKMCFFLIVLGGLCTSCAVEADPEQPDISLVGERDLDSCAKYSAHRFANCIAEAGKSVESLLIYEAMAARGDDDAKEFLSNMSGQLDFEGYIERSKQSAGEN